MSNLPQMPIAIVGRGCVLPGAFSPAQLWQRVQEGSDLLTRPPAGAWPIHSDRLMLDASGTRWSDRGGYVRDFQFDPHGFGMDPEELMRFDRCAHWVLQASRDALHETGHDPARGHRRTGAILGHLSLPLPAQARYAESFWLRSWAQQQGLQDLVRQLDETPAVPGNRYMSALPARMLVRALGLGAEAFTLDAACASSLYALKLACDALQEGRADLMLAGAVCGTDPMFLHIGFRALKALSPTGQSRPFHRDANGLVPSEGAVVFALKRLSDAQAAGDRVVGVIRGIGLSNDGGAAGLLVPSSDGQVRAMRQALERAQLAPQDVALMECHATGTQVGDSVELSSIGRVYGACGSLPIGSIKSQMGHLLTVSGAAGILKVLGAFEAGVLPRTLDVQEPTASLARAPVRLLTSEEPWPTGSQRIAAVSSFGFGGNNAHIILQAHDGGTSQTFFPAARLPDIPLAVVGLGVIAAGAGNTAAFARLLREGGSALADTPNLGRCGMTPAFQIGHSAIRFPPRDLAASMPQQVILLKTVHEALALVRDLPRERTGVLVGMECDSEIARHLAREVVPDMICEGLACTGELIDAGWMRQVRDAFAPTLMASTVTGFLPNIVANRLNTQFKLGGQGYSLCADELSGLRALDLAIQALRRGELDAAIVAAVDLCCESVTAHAASSLRGTGRQIPGDAAVVLVLKRIEAAQSAGEPVLALLEGMTHADALKPVVKADRLQLGDVPGALHLGAQFGHAHAASGLLHVAAAIACQPRYGAKVTICSQDGQQLTTYLRTSLGLAEDSPTTVVSEVPREAIEFASHLPAVALPDWPQPAPKPSSPSVSTPPEHVMTVIGLPPTRTVAASPLWTRADLEEMACGLLSRFFGHQFEAQDGYARQVRLPMPPLLMLDRVLSIEGEAGTMGLGRVVSETDIAPDAWYLQNGSMPAGLEIEAAGQANLLLISYLGADLLNRGERVYRLLGSEVTCHGDRRPRAGDTLRYETEVTGHARSGEARLFFFKSDSYLNGQLRLSVRHAHAGFFTLEELEKSGGVLWDPAKDPPDPKLAHTPATASFRSRSFHREQANASSAGLLQMIDEVTHLDPEGGPWRRGYLRATQRIRGDEWFFQSHFKNDPTMPGALMFEAGLQMMHLYLSALGHTHDREQWSLQLVPSRSFKALCRGQITPDAQELSYEVFVRGLEAGDHPTLWADIVLTVHGRKAFHARNLGVRLMPGLGPEAAATKPLWNRADLEEMSHGRLSRFFGPKFKVQDGYARQVRMPMPPLLLADRVISIEGEPGAMGLGRIVTETDITPDAWYLHEGSMPAGLEVEAGQADLLLISYLGADLLNRGDRVYRLLGCEMTYHGNHRPRVGDTLRYDIKITGHAQTGDVRLFFFHYDSYLNGELRLSVRNGRAGFFSIEELDNAGGVLWDPLKDRPDDSIPHVPAPDSQGARTFSSEQVVAFAKGQAYACFGPGFERLASHHRTPRIQHGKMQLFEQVEQLDPRGGPWGRGYLRASYRIQGDEWFFPGHFHNDPTMPGTLMCEAGIQMMGFYLAAMGHTIPRDGWTFELLPSTPFTAACRGQVTPQSREMTYEIFVRGLAPGNHPTLWADVLLTVDGRKAFHGRNLSVRLWPGVPLNRAVAPAPAPGARPPATVDGFTYDGAAMLHCATGLPSLAFGPHFQPFDGARNLPRLPSAPYQFMSRVTRCDAPPGSMQVGSAVEIEYDLPDEAWYFDDNDGVTMPFAVLLEAALQPCGWLAAYMGVPLQCETDLNFRNLDGEGTLLRPVRRGDGILRTSVRCTSIARNGDTFIEAFDVECRLGDTRVYTLKTVFGHFTAESLRAQKGLPATEAERTAVQARQGPPVNLITEGHASQLPRLARSQLLMLDQVNGFWPQGGAAGRGRLLAQFDVNPNAWFFKAHFYRDPVQPGSLGIEAMIQLLQFYMRDRGLAAGMRMPRFEPLATGRPMAWKYRGQVLPTNRRVSVEMDIHDEGRDTEGPWVSANAWLWVDGLRIYFAKGLTVRIVEGETK